MSLSNLFLESLLALLRLAMHSSTWLRWHSEKALMYQILNDPECNMF